MVSHPDNRPRFLRLTRLHFPLNALISAAHRISGTALIISLTSYLLLANALLLNPALSLSEIANHWSLSGLHNAFWIGLSFHWLTGLRHLLAEHFTQATPYRLINSTASTTLLLSLWLLLSTLITYQVWS